MNSEFYKIGTFYPAAIVGYRAFKTFSGEVGLRSVFYHHTWKPGPNTAGCAKVRSWRVHELTAEQRAEVARIVGAPADSLAARLEVPAVVHRLYGQTSACNGFVTADCQCGFYSFFVDPSQPRGMENYIAADSISGIIRGSGKVTLGPKGFRAQHAQIVALSPQVSGPSGTRAHVPDNYEAIASYYEVPWFSDPREMVARYPTSQAEEFMPAREVTA